MSQAEIQEIGSNLIAGKNVNMVSGTVLPEGDPYLQRQNEPSVAVSTRNPLHLLAGSNDYRTVDLPFSEGALDAFPEQAAAAGDAWLGVFKSYDGGKSWISTLLPGYPQDTTADGLNSPLYGYQAAADPTVRAGTNGLFFYSGIAFNRIQNGKSVIFVSRFLDNNDTETGDSIDFIDTSIIDEGTSGQFGDKPWIAVDKPRNGNTSYINGQDVPVGNVYIVYSIFLGDLTSNIHNKVMFVKSSDYGNTWEHPVKLSESESIGQGTTLAIDPESGDIYVTWRRFANGSNPDAIIFCKSSDGGKKWTKAKEVRTFAPFDQPSIDIYSYPGAAFRTNAFPTMAVGLDGEIFIAWAQKNENGMSRIVLASSSNGGNSWDNPIAIDPVALGHQFMPTLTYSAGKLTAAWYDSRNDYIGGCVPDIIADIPDCEYRHTIDVMAAQLNQYAEIPTWSKTQVSRYIFYLVEDSSSQTGYSASQMQFNPPNYPLFKGGTQPFMGDYIDIAPSPWFVVGDNGEWRFNTLETDPSSFHVVWTDNRDVRPPSDADWTNNNFTNYNPPSINPGQDPPVTPCNDGDRTGMRNQNIYTALLSSPITIGSPGNFKPFEEGIRSFAVFVENNSGENGTYELALVSEVEASFLPFEIIDTLELGIAGFSSVSRSVFVEPNPDNPKASIRVDVYALDAQGGRIPVSLASVVLNLDPDNPDILVIDETHTPDISATPIVNSWNYSSFQNSDTYSNPDALNPTILNPTILNPTILNPTILNPTILNPTILNPTILNPTILNPTILNPTILNPTILNPTILNPTILNPTILNPTILNTPIEDNSFSDATITDIYWTVTNEGNTTSTYTFKMIAAELPPAEFYNSLEIYRINYNPSAESCELGNVPHQDLILRITDPNILNPTILNPTILNPTILNPNIEDGSIENATFTLAPGEVVLIDLQVIDPGAITTDSVSLSAGIMETGDEEPWDPNAFADGLATVVTAHSPNPEGVYDPIALQIITVELPPGEFGVLYDQLINTIGGDEPYTWVIDSGVLPPNVFLTPESGKMYLRGSPTGGGEYTFTIKVTDVSNPQQVDYQTLTINILDHFTLSAVANPVEGGTVSPSDGTYVDGGEVTLIADPIEEAGYEFVNWTGTGVPAGHETDNPLTIVMIGDANITANFELIEYSITASSGAYGTIDPTGESMVEHGSNLTFTITADPNYHIAEVLVDGNPQGPIGSYTFENVAADHSISATFAIDAYTITSSAGENGSITPLGESTVDHGSSLAFTIAADPNYHIVEVLVDGNPQGPIGTYTFENIAGAHTISATFAIDTYTITSSVGANGSVSPLGESSVEYGSSLTFNIGADSNYHIADVVVDTVSQGPIGSYTFENVAADHSISATFAINTYTISGTVKVMEYPLEGVEMMGLIFPDGTTLKTNDSGTYTAEVTWDWWPGEVMPSMPGYTFTPSSISYTGTPMNNFEQNYIVNSMQGNSLPNSSNGDTVANDVATDSSGNVYVVGYTTGDNGTDIYIALYDPSGELVAEKTFDGSGNGDDMATAVAIQEINGSVYVFVTGSSTGSTSGPDIWTFKFDGNLTQLWTKAAPYDGPAHLGDYATAITVDDEGNVYVTGYSYRGVQWKHSDYITIKYDSSGNEVWNARYDARRNGNDEAYAIAVDSARNVYITGKSQYSLNNNKDVLHYDYFTVKYNSSGKVVWDARDDSSYQGDDEATALGLVENEDGIFVYVTGFMATETDTEAKTIKYDGGTGNKVGLPVVFEGKASAMAVQEENGEYFIYVTGHTDGTNADYHTVKYDSSLDLIWNKEYDGGANDQAKAIGVDAQGIYVTGTSFGSGGDLGIFTLRYDVTSGDVIWFASYDNAGDEVANAIAIGPGYVYVSGYIQAVSDGPKDFITLKYLK
ncbi:SBBP repeat-containing protein [Acidobacteriota bacterium]